MRNERDVEALPVLRARGGGRMKVYLVYWCNNEQYEDYTEIVEGVYSTREKAIAAIESQGYRKGPTEFYPYASKEKWNKEDWYDEDNQPWALHTMWVRGMVVDEC